MRSWIRKNSAAVESGIESGHLAMNSHKQSPSNSPSATTPPTLPSTAERDGSDLDDMSAAEGYEFASGQPSVAEAYRADGPPINVAPSTDQPAADRQQFTLTGLLVLFTVASIMLAGGRLLPPRWFAGLAGLAALLVAALSPVWERLGGVWQVGWWMLLGLYLMAVCWAVGQG